MANTVLTADVIAKEALAILDNETGWMRKLHRGHQEEFSNTVNGYEIGDTVSIRRPADFTIRTGATMSTQDVVEGKTTLQIDTQKGVDFQFTSTDLTLKIEDLSERVIKPACINLLNDVAKDVLDTMYRGAYHWAGTPGQTINSFSDFSVGPKRLDKIATPMQDRCAILSPDDHWGVVASQTSLLNASLVGEAYKKGSLGEIGGVSTYMSQVAPTHTVGALGGTGAINGASQNVTYDTAKNTWTQSLITDGWSNSVTGLLKAGDVFTIPAVFMVNPKTKAKTNVLQQFVVTADADSDGSGNATLTISPPIISSGQHQTVDAAPADNAVLSVAGTADTEYTQNLCFHKNAMALAVVPMEMPQGSINGSRKSHKDLSIRIIPTYDGVNDISKWRMDILYGKKLIDPRILTRFSGTA